MNLVDKLFQVWNLEISEFCMLGRGAINVVCQSLVLGHLEVSSDVSQWVTRGLDVTWEV